MVRVNLLGGVGATSDDGRPLDVGPAKCQALLAALAVSAGSPVAIPELVALVWGADPPRTAEKTLQGYVARLRRALGPDAIARVGAAYRLEVPPEAVDVTRFERALAAGDPHAALAEWSGAPLAGLDAEGLAPAAERLEELRLGAIEADLEHRLIRQPAAVIAELGALTAAHPFREGLWALLMTALYRAGRQADALDAYRRARSRLVDELGVEPGPRLRELEAMVLGQDERLPIVPAGVAGNLPRRRDRLVGRGEDLRAVGEALAAAPVVTLVGPGGVGKTRLALDAAHRAEPEVAGDAWLVELAPIAAPADVPRVVASTLAVTERGGRAPTEALVTAFARRRALVVLDNCEHVLAAAAGVARALAEGCPHSRILATSREPLGVPGEHVLELGPLDPDGAAADLFAERARAADRTFDPTTCRDDVREICRRLDGLPLAIELAAARVRSLPPAALRDRLDDRLRLLVAPRPTDVAHHRTLGATIAWSYDLLSGSERAVFERLAVFGGSFDLEAAEALASDRGRDPVEVATLLGTLVDRSMVAVEPGPGGRRFRLLETMRQFAWERLIASGDEEDAVARHAMWCRGQVQAAGRALAGPDEAAGVARVDALWPDLRAAVDRACSRGDHALARDLVAPVAPEVLLRGRAEIGDWAERILDTVGDRDPEAIAEALEWAAQRCTLTQDHDRYESLIQRHGEPDHPLAHHARAFLYEDYPRLVEWTPPAMAALRRAGRHNLAEFCEMDVGAALLNLGRLDEHDRIVGALAERYRAEGPPSLVNWALMLLGYSALFQANRPRAESFFAEAIDVVVPPRTNSPNRPIEAGVAFRRGERERAYRVLRDHVRELIDTDVMHGADITAVEFTIMTAALGMLPETARMVGYLEATNLLEAAPFAELVAEPARRMRAGLGERAEAETEAGRAFDDRAALGFMHAVLRALVAEPPGGSGTAAVDAPESP